MRKGNEEKERSMTKLKATSSQEGLKDGWTRATFILRKDYLQKVKALAYWDRRTVKEIVGEALEAYLKGKRIKTAKNKRPLMINH